jgi:hypothetical protein
VNCPVAVSADLGALDPRRAVLRSDADGSVVPCQVSALGGLRFRIQWLLTALAARGRASFTLSEEAPGPAHGGVRVTREGDRIDVRIGGEPFTTFHFAESWSRPFLYPVLGPYGAPLTRAYPMRTDVPGEKQDHPHHKSLWVAWGDVNGTDNWSEDRQRGHATQRVRTVTACEPGPISGRIACLVDWLSEKGAKVLEEDREMVFWNMPAAGRALDLTVTFRATEGPVRFGDTKEGGLCSIRVASSMDAAEAGTIVNSFGGTNEPETWGKRAHWCDYCGPVNGRTVGIAIFDHPTNFRHPTYWHVRNYGLMTANPFGLSHFLNDRLRDGSHTLAAGGSLTFRYRVYGHAGSAAEAAIATRYHDFVNPPAVTTTSA